MMGQRQKGVALAVLLWFIAAMTILVAGLTVLAKTDTRYARLYNASAMAEALGDGAIRLLLAQQVDVTNSPVTGSIQFGGYTVYLRAVPKSGLIDVMAADEQMLVALLTVAAGLDDSAAQTLAQSVIKWRAGPLDQDDERKQVSSKPNVLEDVMAVPGVSRDIFERIKWLICLGCGGPSFEQADSMPAQVRLVLQSLGQGMVLSDESTANVEQEQVKISTAGVVRVDARLDTGPAGVYQRSVWVAPGGKTRLGWRFIRPQRAVAVPSVHFNEL